MNKIELQTTIPEELTGKRLDHALATLYPEHSRSRIQSWINAGDIHVNNEHIKQKYKVVTGDIVKINVEIIEDDRSKPEAIPLDIIHEDESLIIVNKPAGLVVHPGAGNPNHTLVNALLNFDKKLSALPRAGIIHRLDKDTTGVMIIARTLEAHTSLVKKLQNREIKREYQAIVSGQITAGGSIENKMGRHPVHRKKMAVINNGKSATTHYRIAKKYQHYTHLFVQLETGRTHQIRVHMAHIKHPIIGDTVYGKNKTIKKGINNELREIITGFKRQALHAYRLTLPHPESGEIKRFDAELPQDVKQLIEALEIHDSP